MRRPHPVLRAVASAAPLLLLGYVMSYTSIVEQQAVLALVVLAGMGLWIPGSSITTLSVVATTATTQSPGLAAVAGISVFLVLWVFISDVDRLVVGVVGSLTLVSLLADGKVPTWPIMIPAYLLFLLVVARSGLVGQLRHDLGETTRPSRRGFLPERSSELTEAGWPCVGVIDDGKDKAGFVLHSEPAERSYAVVRHNRVWLISRFGDRYFTTTDSIGGPPVPPELTQRMGKNSPLVELLEAHAAGLRVLRPHGGEPEPMPADSVDQKFRRGHTSDRQYILDHSWSVTVRMLARMITRPDRPLADQETHHRIAAWLAAPGQGPAQDIITR